MSTNRLSYDECSYKQSLLQSVSPINYMLDPIKYERQDKCRPELGIAGGTNVSHIKGNLVDLENELRGQRHPVTNCSMYKYAPSDDHMLRSVEPIKLVDHPAIDTRMTHLNSCQFHGYPPVPKEPTMEVNRCG